MNATQENARDNSTLELIDESGRRYVFDTQQLGRAMFARAQFWLRADMSQETALKRAMVSAMLRTGQGMIQEMAAGLAPAAPAGTFKRAKGQDILEWFALVVAALMQYGLPSQSPVRIQTEPMAGGDDETRSVVAVALAARAQRAGADPAAVGGATAGTAI